MKKPIWNIDSVKDKCKELGLEYLSENYKHDIKGLYKCSCGLTFERLFLNVLKKQTLCLKCVRDRDEKRKKEFLINKFNEFKEYVENESNSGCIVESDYAGYKSNKSKIKMICSCGNSFQPNANNFYKGHMSCSDCGNEKNHYQRE